MASRAVALVAGIIDQIEDRPLGTGRPPMPTIKVVETLRFFVRDGGQWRELRATARRACGATLRRRLEDWSAVALLRRSMSPCSGWCARGLKSLHGMWLSTAAPSGPNVAAS